MVMPTIPSGRVPPIGTLASRLPVPLDRTMWGGREAGGHHRPVGIERFQGVQAVGGHREVGPDILRLDGVRFIYGGLDPGALQRQSRHGTGDTSADDQGSCRRCAPIRVVQHGSEAIKALMDLAVKGYTGFEQEAGCFASHGDRADRGQEYGPG